MTKISFAKKMFVLALLACATFVSGNEKVIIERSKDSDIESIVIEKDVLLIKSKGKIYTFKFSELLKIKSAQTKKADPKNLNEAFALNGDWCFFKRVEVGSNSLKYFKKNMKKSFKEGDFLERVLYKGKYYARDLDGKIYEPHWEVKKDFSPHLVSAKIYIKYLANNLKLLAEYFKKLEPKIPKAQDTLKTDREKYITLLTKNNLTTTMIDNNGNISTSQSSGKYSGKIKSQLRRCYKNIRKQEKEIKASIIHFNCSASKLRSLRRRLNKSKALYMQHAKRN